MCLRKFKGFKSVVICIMHFFLYVVTSYCSADTSTAFSKEIIGFSNYIPKKVSLKDHVNSSNTSHIVSSPRPDISLNFKSELTGKKAGSFIYKAISDSRRIVQNAAMSTIFASLEVLGLSKSVKKGINYIEQKTNYDFGKCSNIRFTNKIKVVSCLNERSNIEFLSDYNVDSISINFNWSL